MKQFFKIEAIKLRQQGFSYSEILEKVEVSRSTLSLWLRSVGLAKAQKQRLTKKRYEAALRGSQKKKRQRIEKTLTIKEQAATEVGLVNERDLWLAGIMLYWAEGAKAKDYNVSVGVKFGNSDSMMVEIFLRWLKKSLKVSDDNIIFEIYIHESYKERKNDFIKYWSSKLKYSVSKFSRVYFKKNSIKIVRKNVGNSYHGQLVVRVRKSTDLNRKVSGWIEGFYKQCGIV